MHIHHADAKANVDEAPETEPKGHQVPEQHPPGKQDRDRH